MKGKWVICRFHVNLPGCKIKLHRRQTYVSASEISTTRAVGWIPLHSSKKPLGNFLDLPRNLTLFATHPIALGAVWKKNKTTTFGVSQSS